MADDRVKQFADELRKWWSFDDGQVHMHTWHDREDFIAKKLPELLAAPLPAQEVTDGCYDCKRPYGNENGFPDLIIPNDAWERISPSGNLGGLLCPSCICKRLHDAKITCEGAFMSGPIESVSRPTMYALRRVENAEQRLNELESALRTGEDR